MFTVNVYIHDVYTNVQYLGKNHASETQTVAEVTYSTCNSDNLIW